jgi:hypothetical protein
MAKEKADSSKRGWLARWRERRALSKLRADEVTRRRYNEYSAEAERRARVGGGYAERRY